MLVVSTVSGFTLRNGALTFLPGFPGFPGLSTGLASAALTTTAVGTDAPPSEVRRFFVTWTSSPGVSGAGAGAFDFLDAVLDATGGLASDSEEDESESESESESEFESSDVAAAATCFTALLETPFSSLGPPASLDAGVDSVRLESRSAACFGGLLASESLDSSSESSEDELEDDADGATLALDFTAATGTAAILGVASDSESESELDEDEDAEDFFFVFFFNLLDEAEDEDDDDDDDESESESESELEEEDDEESTDDAAALRSFHSRIISSSCGPSISNASFRMTTSFAAFFKAAAALGWACFVRNACIRV